MAQGPAPPLIPKHGGYRNLKSFQVLRDHTPLFGREMVKATIEHFVGQKKHSLETKTGEET